MNLPPSLSDKSLITHSFKLPSPFILFLKKHGELLAAIISGLLLLYVWTNQNHITESTWIVIHVAAFLIGGYAKAKEGIQETIENRTLNVEMLMVLAAIGAASIGYWTEGAILIFIFALSGALETYTLNKNEQELSNLLALQPEEALRISHDIEEIVPVASLKKGDIILVKPGERMPVDGTIIQGETAIDESAITGESIPVAKQIGSTVFAGTINGSSSIKVEMTTLSSETLFQKIINMVQSAQDQKSPSQQMIERFEGLYVKIVLVSVALMMFLPHFFLGWSWSETIYRAMVLLVVASPCAVVASIMPATLSAISRGAKQGILFKGGVYAEQLASIQTIVFDKTGTLTNGKPVVTDTFFIENDPSIYATIEAIERQSNHPLAKAIVEASRTHHQLNVPNVDFIQDESGKGVAAVIDGTQWKIGNAKLVGEDHVVTFQNGMISRLAGEGKTVVVVSRDGKVIGLFALQDTIRRNAADAIEILKKTGIRTVMLTGDQPETAKAIAKHAGIDEYVASCLPDDKVSHIVKYQNVAMVGDGINDAPALATANVGIAMGEGSDVALETADVVLMKNDLTKIAQAIDLSKKMNRIIKQNLIFSTAVILLLIASNFAQWIDLPFGVIGHEGSTILVILNGLRLLSSK
ncbi:cadmium-translocating P-type ATPase [Radiobacillus kanasensis]|uniref:heavy metal translocating P-type ATPase n=1 Tax=Radiobacillus kanasensis TaxID=2844358 RepID=UPI001E2DE6E9|nr:heavy metal translocating P-type ATPase [Radiobacillus kanasensis]UFU00012.1 cadmium-translocating P-type ATPase [Radiobacillus kanasensis]